MDEKTIPIGHLPPHLMTLLKEKKKEPKNFAWGEDIHYRALFDQTGESVFIIGMDFHYIAANQQALDLLGYKKEELIGLPVSSVMLLDGGSDKEPVTDYLNVVERILRRKNGSTLPVEISASIIYNDKNEPAYIQSIARDISERKRSEFAVTRYSRILSAINNATARLLRSSNIETMIPDVIASLGEAIGVSCCAIFEINTFSSQPIVSIQYQWVKKNSPHIEVPKMISPFISSILNILGSQLFNADDPSHNCPFIIIPIHGTLDSWGFLGLFDVSRNFSWSTSERDAAEMAAGLIGSALQRTSYEETIRSNEARNRIILSALPDLLIRLDANGVILDYTTNPDHPLYLHRDMISGKKLSEIWPLETVQKIMGELERDEGFPPLQVVHQFTLPFSASDYESRLVPISATEVLIVIRDVTDQARLDRMKSDFINRASHELRTPLTTAILMIDLIQDGADQDDLNQYWRTLKSELNRQKILIDRLLIAGRLESGMMELDNKLLNLIPVLEESILAVKPISDKRNISIKLLIPQEEMNIIGDNSGLQQVFINLINNAIKFSPKGSVVEVNVRREESQTHVSIADHGLGIPPESMPQLFQRFYRAKNVTIAEIPGSGIGLYIVKSIVEGLGGSIRVESVQDRGTIFTVTLNNGDAGKA